MSLIFGMPTMRRLPIARGVVEVELLSPNYPDLVAYYTMDNISGATLADETPNGNDGTITGAVAGDGLFDGGLNFTTSDYVNIPLGAITTGAAERTVSLWFYRATTTSDEVLYMMGTNTSNDAFLIAISTSDLHLSFWGTEITAAVTYAGAWHHVAAVYDGTDAFLYFDGAEVATVTRTLTTGSSIHRIGTRNLGAYFNGDADQFRLFDRALTPAEILELSAETPTILLPSNPDLLAAWTFDNISGSTVYDESANANDGTLSGTTGTEAGAVGNAIYMTSSAAKMQFTAIPTWKTVAIWHKKNTASQYSSIAIETGAAKGLYSWPSGSGSTFYMDNGGTQFNFTTTATATYALLILEDDGTNFNLYVDGVLDATAITRFDVSIDQLGNSAASQSSRFDQVRVFDRLLNATERAALLAE
ncbi:MAG: LamG domain-containing protein [Porticoccus sp.]|nr:LamG domain-containing protein [Porticoccus sp.]